MKSTSIIIIIVAIVVAGIIIFVPKNNSDTVNNQNNITSGSASSSNNVSVVNGVQIIDLQAKGGYSPRKSIAKAGLPTIIRFETNNTFDCSVSIRIPSLNISQFLPQTGKTEINIGTSTPGLFRGSCGMGMYPFEVDFQ